MTTHLRRTLAALLALLAPASVVGTWLALRADLPDPLPRHWDLQGRVDGTVPATPLLATTLTVSLVLAGLVVALLLRRTASPAERAHVVGLVWTAWLAAAIWDATALMAASAARAEDVGLTWWGLAAVVVVPAALAAAAGGQVPVPPAEPAAEPAPRGLVLGETERAVWVGSSSSRPMLLVSAALMVAAAVTAVLARPAALPLGVAAIALLWVHAVTVVVDDRGLAVAWGPLRWPRTRVRLDDVVDARVEEIVPTAWGGWGYRMTPHATAAVTRGGPGMVVERRSGRRFAVTVDRPEAGVELLNALRQRPPRTDARPTT